MFSGLCAKTRDHKILLFPVLLSLALTISRYHTVGLTMDGVTYLQIARNILLGQGLGWQATWASPLYSILVAVSAYFSGTYDLLAVASAVSAVLGVLLIPAVYFLAYQVFDRRVAIAAALLATLSPHLITIAGSDETEIAYTFFLILALGFFTFAIRHAAWPFALCAGLAFALAYLARSEGFLVMTFVLLAVCALQGKALLRSKVTALCVGTALVAALAASPYLFFLNKSYGSLVISPKTSYVMIWMKCFTYHDNNYGEEGNPELWGLSESGKLHWQEPKGIVDLLRYLGEEPARNGRIYLENLSHELPGRISNGSGMERFPQLFPIYLVMAAFGSVFLGWGRAGKEKKAILCAPLLILLVLPVFTGGWWKYLVSYLPIVLVLAVKGSAEVARLAAWKLGARTSSCVEGALLAALVAGISLHFLSAFYPAAPAATANPLQAKKNSNRQELVKAAQYGRQLLGPGHNYMISWSPIVYYLEGIWTARPVASAKEQFDYARKHGVEYFVLDVVNPQITAEEMSDQAGLQLVGLYRSASTPVKVGFYRLTDR